MDVAKKKIRVMHLNTYIGYDGPSRGIIAQAKYTNRDRFEVVICEIKTTRHPELLKTIEDIGCEHLSLNQNKIYDLFTIFKLKRLLKEKKIDILNTHNALACWYGNIAAKLTRIPVVFTLRGYQDQNYKYFYKKKFIYSSVNLFDCFMIRGSDKVVAVSNRLKDYYVKNMCIPHIKIISISNAIDLDQLQIKVDRERIRKSLGIDDRETVIIGMVGPLVELKGHSCLIQAAKLIIQEQGNIRFLVIGDGVLRDDLKAKIEQNSLSGYFIFAGHKKEVIPLFSVIDIFVSASFAEGLSRSLMESMALGIPSVCSSIEGNLEAVINGETGFVFDPGNYAMLADKLKVLIKDRRMREVMGAKAKERAESEFDMKKAALKYENLYLEILSGQKKR